MTVQRASDLYASNLKNVLEIDCLSGTLIGLGRVRTSLHLLVVCPIVNAPAGRLLGAYDIGAATPRAVEHAGDKTSGDARSWYMISRDANSWVSIKIDGSNFEFKKDFKKEGLYSHISRNSLDVLKEYYLEELSREKKHMNQYVYMASVAFSFVISMFKILSKPTGMRTDI
ncbi:hypothetical protein Tco_0596340 [Tanacetum coccineum]